MSRRYNRDDIDQFHDYKLHIPTRTIFMGSETVDLEGESGTDASMAERFLKNIHILDSVSAETITVIMNNIGGEVEHGFAIYDAIRCARSKVTIKVFGHAMSMGSVILQAANLRIMAPTAKQMIHYGTIDVSGHSKTVEKIVNDASKIDKWMEKVYLDRIQAKNPDYTLEQLKAILNHNSYFTAKASVAMGLADEVLEEPVKEKK